MKTPQQEIMEAITANAGNRLTHELIAGLQVRINQIFMRENPQLPNKEEE